MTAESTAKSVKKAEETHVDYLMWVGSVFYPTVDSYIAEAKGRGCCKRLGKVPLDMREALKEGKTVRIFLAHDDGLEGEGFVFGYFIPTHLQYIYENLEDIPYQLVDYVTPVHVSEIEGEEERECGTRFVGAYAIQIPLENGDEGGFFQLELPRILDRFDPERAHFRGLLRINYGEKLIAAKKSQMMVPPSRQAPKVDPETPWAEDDDALVLEYMEDSPNRARSAQEVAFQLGRTKSAVLYRFRKLTGYYEDRNGKVE